MSQIYKITNLINQKIYVGKSLEPDENYYGSGLQITAAIEKYGKENFSKEILEECHQEDLDSREIYWIEKLDSRNPLIGYNISIGGTGGNHYWKSLDEEGKAELRKKISNSRSGQKTRYTEKRRQNVKEGLKKFWENKKNDIEWLKSRSPTKKYILSNKTEFIRIENLKDYCKKYNLGESHLCSISTGKEYKSFRGWYCFADDGITNEEVLIKIELLEEKQRKVRDEFLEKIRNRPRYECSYCGLSVTKSNLVRWHNENCKENGKM